jgi:hypothetical protein
MSECPRAPLPTHPTHPTCAQAHLEPRGKVRESWNVCKSFQVLTASMMSTRKIAHHDKPHTHLVDHAVHVPDGHRPCGHRDSSINTPTRWPIGYTAATGRSRGGKCGSHVWQTFVLLLHFAHLSQHWPLTSHHHHNPTPTPNTHLSRCTFAASTTPTSGKKH